VTATTTAAAVTVRVGGTEYPFSSLDAGWLHGEIERLEQTDAAACVVITATSDEVQLSLPTPACGPSPRGGRLPNERERAVIERWQQGRLASPGWRFDDLWSFLQQLQHML
jgi:hypothetical protein